MLLKTFALILLALMCGRGRAFASGADLYYVVLVPSARKSCSVMVGTTAVVFPLQTLEHLAHRSQFVTQHESHNWQTANLGKYKSFLITLSTLKWYNLQLGFDQQLKINCPFLVNLFQCQNANLVVGKLY